jgi:LAO/AO transport system kinase
MTKSKAESMNISLASKRKLLESHIIKAAPGGKITCARLRKIAEKSNVSYKMAGRVADELQVKIKKCDLGCF